MRVGIPKEIKIQEFRVGMTPEGVDALVRLGHQVFVETSAGLGSGFSDEIYRRAGATISPSANALYASAEMIVKVKEPLATEYALISAGQIVFTYFHFAASRILTHAMIASHAVCIAYETVELSDGSLPLLVPMSEVAGRMSIDMGSYYLGKPFGGKGKVLGGVPGVKPAEVLILGGGVVGTQAAKMAAGLGARVTIMDTNLSRLRYLSDMMPPNVVTQFSTSFAIREKLPSVDLLIGAVLLHGAKAPQLVLRDDLSLMEPGSVIVDVAVDQGGCIETCRPTTHDNPVYLEQNVLHYCVANMPGAVPQTSTMALTQSTLPYVLAIANKGWETACAEIPALAKGLNIVGGKILHQGVAESYSINA
jgi:alanine dehydrogenase